MPIQSRKEALKILGLSEQEVKAGLSDSTTMPFPELSIPGETIQQAFERRLFSIHPDTKDRYEKASAEFTLTVDQLLEARRFLLSEYPAGDDILVRKSEQKSGVSGTEENVEPAENGASGENFSNARTDANAETNNHGPIQEEVRDDGQGYFLYRKADQIYGDALERYFSVRKHYTYLKKSHPAEIRFREELLQAKDIFARVLEDYPSGRWMVDSVERIARINNWLGSEGDAARTHARSEKTK